MTSQQGTQARNAECITVLAMKWRGSFDNPGETMGLLVFLPIHFFSPIQVMLLKCLTCYFILLLKILQDFFFGWWEVRGRISNEVLVLHLYPKFIFLYFFHYAQTFSHSKWFSNFSDVIFTFVCAVPPPRMFFSPFLAKFSATSR